MTPAMARAATMTLPTMMFGRWSPLSRAGSENGEVTAEKVDEADYSGEWFRSDLGPNTRLIIRKRSKGNKCRIRLRWMNASMWHISRRANAFRSVYSSKPCKKASLFLASHPFANLVSGCREARCISSARVRSMIDSARSAYSKDYPLFWRANEEADK